MLSLENANVFKAPAWRSNLVINIIIKKNKEKIFDKIVRKIDEEHSGKCGVIFCLHQTDVMDISYCLTHKDPSLPVSVTLVEAWIHKVDLQHLISGCLGTPLF